MAAKETTQPDPRWPFAPPVPRSKSLLPHTLAVCVTLLASALIVANAIKPPCGDRVNLAPPKRAPDPTEFDLIAIPKAFESVEPPLANVPCDAQANQPPFTGPFRPRPKPPAPPEPPAPVPENDAERRLFPRIEALIEARAAKVESRAEAKAEQRVQEALDEVATNMDIAMTDPDAQLVQGAFGSVFVTKLVAFAKKVAAVTVKIVLIGIAWELVKSNWLIVGPVLLFLFIALPAWSARTFAKKTP